MNDTTESKDVVRKIIEKDGLLVSFLRHDGYFNVPDNANKPAVKAQLLESQQKSREIGFVYDRDLNILSIK